MFPAQRELPDDALVARCLQGDGRAWEVLVRRYRSLVWSIALSRGLGEADAADAFQVTWVKVHGSLASLRSADRLTAWIASVARSACSRIHRRRSLDRRAEEVLQQRARPAADSADEAEGLQEVREGLDRLSKRCRDLLRLLYWEEASYGRVSRETGMATGSIGPTRARCLERLRTEVSQGGGS